MTTIKITKLNGEVYHTRINGTEKEIIEFYNTNNFLAGTDNKEKEQVKEIEFNYNEDQTGLIGCKGRKIIYIFEYIEKLDCYLY